MVEVIANQIGFIFHRATAFCGSFLSPVCTLSQTQTCSLNSLDKVSTTAKKCVPGSRWYPYDFFWLESLRLDPHLRRSQARCVWTSVNVYGKWLSDVPQLLREAQTPASAGSRLRMGERVRCLAPNMGRTIVGNCDVG